MFGSERPPARIEAPSPDQVYRIVNTVRNTKKILDGPVGQAECIDVINGFDVDRAGNWAESG